MWAAEPIAYGFTILIIILVLSFNKGKNAIFVYIIIRGFVSESLKNVYGLYTLQAVTFFPAFILGVLKEFFRLMGCYVA